MLQLLEDREKWNKQKKLKMCHMLLYDTGQRDLSSGAGFPMADRYNHARALGADRKFFMRLAIFNLCHLQCISGSIISTRSL